MDFKGSDPGAVKYGNFINYYQFHPPEFRTSSLPKDLWKVHSGNDLLCLDIGCNAGDLTQVLYEFLLKNLKVISEYEMLDNEESSSCYILGVDLDPILVARAQETNKHSSNVMYECLDFMSENKDNVISTFLEKHKRTKFDVIFCFSLTMWIHLNHGDEGLRQFLIEVCKWTNKIVVEPQPWKCYNKAVRRMKRAGDTFPKFTELKLRHTVESDIESILQQECSFVKVGETSPTQWGRKTVFYKRTE